MGNKKTNQDLARARITIQKFQKRWKPEEGLHRGTIFPELYRPYRVKKNEADDTKGHQRSTMKGKEKPNRSENNRETRMRMLEDIMALEFTAIELNLYLNTHPRDERALEAYNRTVKQLNELKKDYEDRFGPLTNFGDTTSEYPWSWVEEPWPWQINFAERRK